MADATIEMNGEAEAEPTTRSQMEKHQGFVDWYNANYDKDLSTVTPAEVIAEFARLRNTYRKSDVYLSTFGPEARAEAAQRKAEQKEALRLQREQERQAKAQAAKEAKEAAEALKAANADAESTEGETKPARKRAARKTKDAPVVDETDSTEVVSDEDAFE